jgi:hypothetical protein
MIPVTFAADKKSDTNEYVTEADSLFENGQVSESVVLPHISSSEAMHSHLISGI